jgi:hypothetical protein
VEQRRGQKAEERVDERAEGRGEGRRERAEGREQCLCAPVFGGGSGPSLASGLGGSGPGLSNTWLDFTPVSGGSGPIGVPIGASGGNETSAVLRGTADGATPEMGGSEKKSDTTDTLSRVDFRGAGGSSRIPPDDKPHAAPSGKSCPLPVTCHG